MGSSGEPASGARNFSIFIDRLWRLKDDDGAFMRAHRLEKADLALRLQRDDLALEPATVVRAQIASRFPP